MDPAVTVAWVCGIGGLLLGAFGALVPGFPGSAVGLLGLVAFAGLTGFEVVGREALILATLIAGAASLGQLLAPVMGTRAAGGTAGAATGAALGAAIGTLIPLPATGWIGAAIGALFLGVFSRNEAWIKRLRGSLGAASGCLVSVGVDLLGVFALGAILALSDFLRVMG